MLNHRAFNELKSHAGHRGLNQSKAMTSLALNPDVENRAASSSGKMKAGELIWARQCRAT
jgi:hypothetical protein